MTGTIELVGIIGYYALISMILNVFRISPPASEPDTRATDHWNRHESPAL